MRLLPSPPTPFAEEDAVALDRWIGDVCGEDVQFPAHRRAQFAAYRERLQRQRESDAPSLFHTSSRSGTREIIALQNMVASVKQLRERDLETLAGVREEIEAIERTLRGRTVTTEEEEEEREGADAREGVAVDESRRKIAERCVAQIEQQRLENSEKLSRCRARYLGLLEHGNQLQKELGALRGTETALLSQHNKITEALTTECDALAREKEAWGRVQQSDVYAGVDDVGETLGKEENGDKQRETQELHVSLREACSDLAQVQAAMSNQDSTHAVRFRKARQRLKDWQEIVRQMRCTHDRLYARTRVIATVVENAALHLETESGLGYMMQLRKLNDVLREKSAKFLGLHKKEEEGINETYSSNAGGGDVQNLLKRATMTSSASATEIASSFSTPPHCHSSRSWTTLASPTVSSSSTTGSTCSPSSQQRSTSQRRPARRTYALLTHLQRWEAALEKETAAFVSICNQGISSDFLPSSSDSLSACTQQLRSLLFQTSPGV